MTQVSAATDGRTSLTSAPGAAPHAYVENGGWAFRAPRYGDLVACPYCDPDTFNPSGCDHCGDEGILFASEVFQ